METRSAIRHEQQQKMVNNSQEQPRRHPLIIIWGIVFTVLLMISLIIGQTLLNARFVNHEIMRSNISSTLMENVDGNLSQYGISTSALTDKESNKLITQAVTQIYSGKEINLNLQPIIKNVSDSASQAAASYGITASLPNSVTSSVGDELSQTINEQLNTTQIKQFTNAIVIAKAVDHTVMIISVIALGGLLLLATLKKSFVRSLSWICLWSTLIGYALIVGLRGMITQIGEHYPDFSSFTAQLGMDFNSQALNYWLILLLITIVLFSWRIVMKVLRKR